MRNPYEVLGIEKSASDEEIKRAYRRLIAKHHPDINKEKDTVEKFKEIQTAWEILSDPQKKKQYDQYGFAGNGNNGGGMGGFDFSDFSDFSGGGFGGGLGDIFESFFGGMGGGRQRGPSRGRDLQSEISITLQEAFSGKKHTIDAEMYDTCIKCTGSGILSGSRYSSCKRCSGTGQISKRQQTPLGIIQTSGMCPDCQGEGRIPENPCPQCHGKGRIIQKKKIGVDIPAGVFDGALLRIPGKGEAGERGQPSGDFLLRVHVLNDPKFERDESDIHTEEKISLLEAVLGNEKEIDTVHGKVAIKIPAGTQPGSALRIRGKGMPILQRNTHGDHLVHIQVEIPKKLSGKEKELYGKLVQESGQKIKSEEKGFLDGLFG